MEVFASTILTLAKEPRNIFAAYLLQQDHLYNKIPLAQRSELISQAEACGEGIAEKLRGKKLAEWLTDYQLQLETFEDTTKVSFNHVLAEFQQPDTIRVNQTLIDVGNELLQAEPNLAFLTGKASLTEILQAHELFHFLEEQDQLFTKEKHVTYKTGPFKRKARIHALSEIAANRFAEAFFQLDYPVLLLNPVLLYPIDEDYSWQFIKQIQQL